MNFCSACGATVNLTIPAGDNRPRYVCPSCDTIHYQNPRIVAGCLPVFNGRVLLCRRAIEPRQGFWTLPAGFMENGETLQEAAARETREEACANVKRLDLYTITSIPRINQVQVFYRAELVDGNFAAGEETLDARLFSEEEIPWDALAFHTVRDALRYFFADRKHNQFPLRHIDLR